MKACICSAVGILALPLALTHAEVIDDFSQGGWALFDSTPGRITAEPGRLYLQDAEGDPSWVTASKAFTVDVDTTPFFLVKVAEASDRGTVKLIRQEPYDKQVAIEIDRPGLYAIDMRDRFGWHGSAKIETCLYAIGDEEEITYEYVKFAEQLSEKDQTLIKERDSGGNIRLNVPDFSAVPLFCSCSVYFRSPKPAALDMLYRKPGGEWLKAFPPAYFAEDGMYRGSIVDLEEGTAYEMKLTGGDGGVLAQTDFTTWSSEVPVAKTIVLGEDSFSGHLAIEESGTPEGWIKYTARPGFVLSNNREGPLLELSKVRYVILEGLMLRGGLQQAIALRRCDHVRIVNCDIAGWGRIGTQRFDLDGKYYTDDGAAINWDSAILVSRCTGTVIERCYVHDPVSTANSWYCSHPAGPQAVGMDKPQSTVLRYNDFIGSDLHRWNDAIEGAGNFDVDGGFNRDADIYGEFHCFANDDAIELDGGQTNVRAFDNKFEGCLCGVSIQGCMSGPSYVFRNLLVNMGDEYGVAGQTIKTSSYANGQSAVSYIFNNTCFGPSSDLALVGNLRIVARNNVFAGRSAIHGRQRSPQSECDHNLLSTEEDVRDPHGILGQPDLVDPASGLFAPSEASQAVGHGAPIDNFAPATDGQVDMGAVPYGSDVVLPRRPIPVYLDRYQLGFSVAGAAAPASQTLTATVRGQRFSSSYKIAKNSAFDWFTVTPDEGTLKSGTETQFTVSVIPDRMTTRKVYRGAFLIRLASGYSRPVTVYAQTDYTPPMKPSREGVFVEYIEAEEPSGGSPYDVAADATASGGKCALVAGADSRPPAEYRFTVPQAGSYEVLMRARSDEPVGSHDAVGFRIDDGPVGRATLRSDTSWVWSMAAHNDQQRLTCLQPFRLTAGEHVLALAPRESVHVDLIAVTDDPRVFD
jgi:hypothetical protein